MLTKSDLGRVQIQVCDLQQSDYAKWEAFVLKHPQSTPFHLLAWKRTIEDSFGYRSMYLLAVDDSQVRGVLPLFFVKNAIIGKALISTPFAVYGGILADCEEALHALHERAVKLGEELGVGHVEFRNRHPEQCIPGPNVDRYVAFSQTLVPDEAALLESLPKKTREYSSQGSKTEF